MISRLRGTLWSMDADSVVIDVQGVGYEVVLPGFVRAAIGDTGIGDEITLETYYHVSERNPRPVLIGFTSAQERAFFEQFISVSGIGPMTAAKALVVSVAAVAEAIENGDAGTLRNLEGIGPRTAEKIVAELRGKMGMFAMLQDGRAEKPGLELSSELEQEAIEILEQLGYRRSEAARMIDDAMNGENVPRSPEELIQIIYNRQPA